MSIVFSLDQGHQARLVYTDGKLVTVVSTKPFPPGSTLSGQLEGEPAPYLVKVRGCHRSTLSEPSMGIGADVPEFVVEGRFVNLSRAQREKVGS